VSAKGPVGDKLDGLGRVQPHGNVAIVNEKISFTGLGDDLLDASIVVTVKAELVIFQKALVAYELEPIVVDSVDTYVKH